MAKQSCPNSGCHPPLRRYYAVAGRLPTFNLHLTPPVKIAVEDGLLSFIDEEQGVYGFATTPDEADPPVFISEDYRVWDRLGEPLSTFLLQYAMFEAVACHRGGWGHVSRENRPRVIDLLPELPLAPWPHPAGRLRFHAGTDTIGLLYDTEQDNLREIWVSTRTASALDALRGLIAWDDS